MKDKNKFKWNPGDIQITRGPGKPSPAAEVKDLAAAITSGTGREGAVRNHLAVAGAFLEQGDTKTACGALDLAQQHARGDSPDGPVLLSDGTEAWQSITSLRDSLRTTDGDIG